MHRHIHTYMAPLRRPVRRVDHHDLRMRVFFTRMGWEPIGPLKDNSFFIPRINLFFPRTNKYDINEHLPLRWDGRITLWHSTPRGHDGRYLHQNIYIHIHVHIYIDIYLYLCLFFYLSIHLYLYLYLYLYLHLHQSIYIHAYMHTYA